MRIHYPKLRNMTHALPLCVFIAFKGTNVSIFIINGLHFYGLAGIPSICIHI